MHKSKPVVTVKNLSKDFKRPGGDVFSVLEGINLEIFEKEFVAIVGISGSGKTTLLRIMAGLLQPDRGSVTFIGTGTKNPIGFVFQNFALFPWLTVKENVSLSVLHLTRKEREVRVEKTLDTLGLSGFTDCYPNELSGGTKQRVSLARALVSHPLCLFLDEPFSNLDPLTAESLRSEILRLWLKEDATVKCIAFVTHSFEEAIQMADRIIVLSSNPGTIYKNIPVALPRPRKINSPEYQKILGELERSFGEMHLDRISQDIPDSTLVINPEGQFTSSPASSTHGPIDSQPSSLVPLSQRKRPRPLINCPLTLVEGLVLRLLQETSDLDLYALCENMNQSVDQMIPAVAAAETLGFVITPGTLVHLTPQGRRYAEEDEAQKKQQLLSDAVLNLPFFSIIYSQIATSGKDGVSKENVLDLIHKTLPFEDAELQFEVILKWGRHCDLFSYETAAEILYLDQE